MEKMSIDDAIKVLEIHNHGIAEDDNGDVISLPKPRVKREDEDEYLDGIRRILNVGVDKDDRTGTGTISTFGMQFRYSLRDNIIPILTTKRIFMRGVIEELLWFMKGSTNGKELSAKGIKIWEANGSREFLDNNGFKDREEGDLGPIYGFQWRHCGAKYRGMHADYSGEGIDQLAKVIETIKVNPDCRRIIMCSWNPNDLSQMVLPPCHAFVQFYVANGELSCQLYQRSADMGLGVPFNIASYALLTHIIANITNLKAGEFIHTMGDAHIYKDHIDPLRQQLLRKPKGFPTISFARKLTDIDDVRYQDITIHNYEHHGKIEMKMSV